MNSLFRSFALVALLRRATGANRSLMLASNSFFSSCFSPFYALNKRAMGLEFNLWFFVRIARFFRVIRSCSSLQKEWKKRFTLLKERSALSLSNKWAILTKNQRAKSQPCSLITCLTCAPLLASQDDPPSPPVGACPRRRWRGIGPPDHPFCRSTKRRQDPRFATKERILALQNRTVIFGE